MNKAIFAKPNIPGLRKDGYRCVDMHCHTRYSDAITKVESIYKKCKRLGMGVAITDHNEVKGALKLAKYRGILAIPGIETTSSEGIHTLFYFYNTRELEEFHAKVVKKNQSENPFSDLRISAIDVVEKARSFNCLISASHPFAPGNTGIYKFTKKKEYRNLLKKVEFIEAINGSNFRSLNKKAIEWGQKLGKKFTGGSDSHTLCSLGNVITAAKGDDFLDSIKKKTLVIGKEANIISLSLRTLLKFRMWGRFPRFYAKKMMREILWQRL